MHEPTHHHHHHHHKVYSILGSFRAQHKHGFISTFLVSSFFHTQSHRREIALQNSDMGSVSCESVPPRASSFHEDPEITRSMCGFDLGDEERERLRFRSKSFGDATISGKKMKKKKRNQVLLEGYVETPDEDLNRTKSLTDEDLDELKGCLDLGFGFSYDEIPELCNTLPALELCYSMSQKFMDEHQKSPENSPEVPPSPADSCSSLSSSVANWKISSPGDHPEDVKARLKFWAQAVACTVRLCS